MLKQRNNTKKNYEGEALHGYIKKNWSYCMKQSADGEIVQISMEWPECQRSMLQARIDLHYSKWPAGGDTAGCKKLWLHKSLWEKEPNFPSLTTLSWWVYRLSWELCMVVLRGQMYCNLRKHQK